VTNCTASQTDILPPTATTDRVCLGHCAASQYISHDATPTASCQTISPTCPTWQYQSDAPVPTVRNRQCSSITNCTVGENFQVVAPTPTTNRVCESTTQCVAGATYATAMPTTTTNRECAACQTCTATQPQQRPCTVSSDRVCASCLANQYVSLHLSTHRKLQTVVVDDSSPVHALLTLPRVLPANCPTDALDTLQQVCARRNRVRQRVDVLFVRNVLLAGSCAAHCKQSLQPSDQLHSWHHVSGGCTRRRRVRVARQGLRRCAQLCAKRHVPVGSTNPDVKSAMCRRDNVSCWDLAAPTTNAHH
jgi:hypothetical protein